MEFESGFSIAGRQVIPLEGRIAGSEGTLRVEPKAMAVLLELARHAPQVRTRAQIERAVWPRG
jgi:DNA-binding winged helix-turn-helix (wHTH) protein